MLAFQDCQVHICTNNCKLFCSNGCYDVQIPEVNDPELLRYLSFHFFFIHCSIRQNETNRVG